MERRYGFTAERAVGCISHQLLGTTSWQALDEIEAVLLNQDIWDGGLIHHRADGQPVMAANHWHVHRGTGGRDALVTELHTDIVPGGTLLGFQLADIVTTMAQELSEPLTALSGYISGAQRSLQPAWPDHLRPRHALTKAVTQLARASEVLGRLRALGENLRDPRLRQLQVSLTANIARTERIVQKSHVVTRETRTIRQDTVLARQERKQARTPSQRADIRQNVQLFQRLLQQDASERLDARTARTLKLLLEEEKAKLASLDLQEGATE